MTIVDVLLPVLCIWGVYIGVGSLFLYLIQQKLRKQTEQPTLLFLVGQWFLLGAGVVTFVQFVCAVIGIPIVFTHVAFCIVAVVGFMRLLRARYSFSKTSLVFLLLLPFVFLLAMRLVSKPMYTWDSIAFWTPKMFALWQDQRIFPYSFESFNHPEYPLLLPMVGATTYALFNAPNEVAVKVALFGFSLALLFLLDGFFSKRVPFLGRIGLLLFYTSLFIVREHMVGEYAGTADVLVGTYIAAGSICMFLRRPYKALLFWAFVPWAKTEGSVWVLASFGLTTLFYFRDLFKERWRLVLPVVFAGGWMVYTKLLGMSSQYFKFSELYARPWIEYFVYAIHSFREEFRNLEKWNLLFFFFITAVLVQMRSILKNKEALVVLGSLLAQICSYLLIFTITPEEQATFIAAAISRLTLHLAPTVFAMTVYVVGLRNTHE